MIIETHPGVQTSAEINFGQQLAPPLATASRAHRSPGAMSAPNFTFEAELQKRNRLLAELGEPPVGRSEFFATRLYTGPVPLATARAHTLCMACTG